MLVRARYDRWSVDVSTRSCLPVRQISPEFVSWAKLLRSGPDLCLHNPLTRSCGVLLSHSHSTFLFTQSYTFSWVNFALQKKGHRHKLFLNFDLLGKFTGVRLSLFCKGGKQLSGVNPTYNVRPFNSERKKKKKLGGI